MAKVQAVGGIPGSLSRPSGKGPWPAVIVIQEWWGLDDQTRSIADRFAEAGYLAFAPDLYRGESAPLGDGETALKLVQKHGPRAPEDLASVFDGLSRHVDVNGGVGSVGFCFGGRMSLELGIRRPLSALCTFYGGGMQTTFDRLGRIRCPVLALFGDQDVSIPVGTIQELEHRLALHGIPHEVKVYPDSGHAFFRDSDPKVYRPAAAKDAWTRVTRFFSTHLSAQPAG